MPTLVKWQLWHDVRDDFNNITMPINWVDFNPRQPNDLFLPWYSQSDIFLLNQTTSFDLTGFQNWHEVWAWLIMIENLTGVNETWTFWIRFKKWTVTIFEFTLNYDLDPWFYSFLYSYIWVDYDEIWSNASDYSVAFLIDNVEVSTINYTVTNLDTSNFTQRTAWRIWVEWDHIHYIDSVIEVSDEWYEHTIWNDWVVYDTWKTPWRIWVDTTNHWRLYYTDSSWNVRRTYLADDWIWFNTWGWNELPLSSKTPWRIWVSNNQFWNWSYWYLVFIWNDWNWYRIMNWAI